MAATSTRDTDVLILGGGPAGATVAATLAKYYPHLQVVLVEQDAFPRYHIGESLIIENNRILTDIDALDRVDAAGFLRKGGATFVWGEDREPWSLLFHEIGRVDRTARQAPGLDYGWHVERGQFDRLLLDVARDHGAEILQPARARSIIEDEDGRVVGAEIEGPEGPLRIHARFVVDAGGRRSLLARRYGKREFDPHLRNVAVHGYWRGVELEARYSGSWERSLIAVITLPVGWAWVIPVAHDLVSIGVVTSHERFMARERVELEDFYLHHVRSAPELVRWLANAQHVQPEWAPRRVMSEADFNYSHDLLTGPGWALVGDAGGFTDPIFSVGVFLAQSAAQLLGYSIGSMLAGELDTDRLMNSYAAHCRAQFDAFRAMAYVFYGFNGNKEQWWQATRGLLRGAVLPPNLSDRDAFIAATFGFGVNALVFREAISCFGFMAGPQVRDALTGRSSSAQPEPRDYNQMPELGKTAKPRLTFGYATSPSAVPAVGTGRMVPMMRVDLDPIPGASEQARFPRHIYVPDQVAAVLPQLDGQHTIAELEQREHARAISHLLRALQGMGALQSS
jgi:flavin-dependent dehydrogenase